MEQREFDRVMLALGAAIGDAERLLNAMARLDAEKHLSRISSRAASSVRDARAGMDDPPPDPDHAQRLMAGLLALARTRLELFSVEFHANMSREVGTLTGKLAALILGITGTGFAALAVAIAIGDEHRLIAAMVSAFAFITLSAACGWATWRALKRRELLLQTSLAELERDLEELKA